jgi:hypothetical protein
MRVQSVLFALTLILSISEIYVSGKPIAETGELTHPHVMHMNKREKCSKEDQRHGKCDSHGNALREQPDNEQDRQDADDSKHADTASYTEEM